MSKRRKRQFRFATFAILPVLLALAALVPAFLSFNSTAVATDASDWTKVKGYVASYIQYQYDAGEEGEAGFLISAASLNSRINSMNDTAILGEGDDAATAPILVDNLGTQGTWIPGTSERCQWNVGSVNRGGTIGTDTTATSGYTQNCFDADVVNRVKAKADAHAAAGFSTDIVDYCVSGKTEAPTTGAWGYIAQTGGLRSDGSKVKVYGLKWGRNGWTNAAASYTRTGAIGAATPSATFTPPTTNAASTNCNSSVSDTELVRCQAQQSIYNLNNGAITIAGMTPGNVSNGQAPGGTAPDATLNAGAVIDTRIGTPGNTVSAYTTYQIPLNTMFTTGLVNLPNPAPGTGLLVAARTPMMGGIVAEGLKMLGYTMAPGGFINDGLPSYNNTLAGGWVNDGATRVALTSTVPDTTAPSVSSVSAGSITTTSAVINRVAGEPATMKVEYGTTSGVYTNTVNNTVLNANKNVSLTGLSGYITYYYKVTSYDGQANGTASAEQSFTTGGVTGEIGIKYNSLGGAGGFLGAPTTEEYDFAGGRAQNFAGGRIYWSPGTGAHEMHGEILVKYLALGPATFGLPTTDETGVPGFGPGRKSELGGMGAAIYWSGVTGAYEVHGAIRGKWLAMGGPLVFGLPTSDEQDVAGVAGAKWSQFQVGNIYWSAGTGAHEMHGAILIKYLALGPATFGLPTTDETGVPGFGPGRKSELGGMGAAIYWSGVTGAYEVHGAIRGKWLAMGGPSVFGMPTSDEQDVAGVLGAKWSQFQSANIYWSLTTGAHEVHGAILAKYLVLGGPAGTMGRPISDEYSFGSGRRSDFVFGNIYWDALGGAQDTNW